MSQSQPLFDIDKAQMRARRHMTTPDLVISAICTLCGIIGAVCGLYVAFFHQDSKKILIPFAIISTLGVIAAAFFTVKRDRLCAMIGLAFTLITPSAFAWIFSTIAVFGALYLMFRLIFHTNRAAPPHER